MALTPIFPGRLLDESHGLAAAAATTTGRNDIQLVDEGVVPAKFKAEAHGQDDVANRRRTVVDKPDASEGGKRQELAKGQARCGFVKGDGARLLFRERPHHGKEYGFVSSDGLTKFQNRHVHSPLCSRSFATRPVHPV